MMVTGWGRYPRVDCDRIYMRDSADARVAIASRPSLIPRGSGLSYGDAALSDSCVLSTLRSDRILAFDPAAGLITCEAGLRLAELLDFAVPRGFFPPVTPGTKFVTIGGMIAADAHGKNQHRAGTISRHVESLVLMTADGAVQRCSTHENADLFAAVCGGMGLIGVVLEATLRLMPIETTQIRQQVLRAANLAEATALFDESANWTYCVAWIDCLARPEKLGRSLIYRGEHLPRAQLPGGSLVPPRRTTWRVPFDFPRWALNSWSVRAFNELYYRRSKPGDSLVDYDTFFYPLDAILEWNRLYGRRGLLQYQCVLPRAAGLAPLEALLRRVSASRLGSFLAVLKLFGAEGDGLLSFPMEGYTLALDLPVHAASFALLNELDAILAAHGGRIYLAKDARANATAMRAYPRLDRFRAIRDRVDPRRKFASLQSRRLGL